VRVATLLLTCIALLVALPASAFVRPDPRLTPGAVGGDNGIVPTAARVCVRGYSRLVRHRYDAEWRRYRAAIFREYGIPRASWSRYAIDHLVPLELGGRPFGISGGTWDLRNVWPEPKTEAKRKDAVEDALHQAVCYRRGSHGLHLSLADAQRAIARDWTQTPVGLPSLRTDISE
jgi:hypothetical protein